jgi:hypothetical protein
MWGGVAGRAQARFRDDATVARDEASHDVPIAVKRMHHAIEIGRRIRIGIESRYRIADCARRNVSCRRHFEFDFEQPVPIGQGATGDEAEGQDQRDESEKAAS